MGKKTGGGGRRVTSARVATGIGDINDLPKLSDRNSLLHDVGMFLEGKTVSLDGFSGRVRYSTTTPKGGGRARQSIVIEPNTRTRNSQEYVNTRQNYGDNYVRDITDSEDLMGIAQRMGYKYGAGNKRDTISGQMTRSGILRGRG